MLQFRFVQLLQFI